MVQLIYLQLQETFDVKEEIKSKSNNLQAAKEVSGSYEKLIIS